MKIIIEDINLVDDPKATGGKAFEGETLADFIEESAKENKITDLTTINNELQECGIEPISSDQIVFDSVRTQDQRECYNSGYQDGYRDAVDELTDKIIKDINKTRLGENRE